MLLVHYGMSTYHRLSRAHVLGLEAGLYEARRPGPGLGLRCLRGWRSRPAPAFGDDGGPSPSTGRSQGSSHLVQQMLQNVLLQPRPYCTPVGSKPSTERVSPLIGSRLYERVRPARFETGQSLH